MMLYQGFGYQYTGNLHVKCAHCGSRNTYHTKKAIDIHICRDCGRKTALFEMKKVRLECECGTASTYYTNETGVFDIPCFSCGQPIDMELVKVPKGKDKGKNVYKPIWANELRRAKDMKKRSR